MGWCRVSISELGRRLLQGRAACQARTTCLLSWRARVHFLPALLPTCARPAGGGSCLREWCHILTVCLSPCLSPFCLCLPRRRGQLPPGVVPVSVRIRKLVEAVVHGTKVTVTFCLTAPGK